MAIRIYDDRLSGANGSELCAVITWTFITDESGNVAEQTNKIINGKINRIVTNPDNIDTPTAFWDVTIKDEDDVDILCGNGANRDANDNGVSEQIFPCPHNLAVRSELTLKITNGGNAKKGVVKVYLI